MAVSLNPQQGKRIHVTGVVQGVGFRPFVYGLAARHGLKGWVCNSSSGVEVEVCGPPHELEMFCNEIVSLAPALSHIESVSIRNVSAQNYDDFTIRHSIALPDEFLPVSADVATCADCSQELFDSQDRRFRYPFINCTQCGPRFTIVTNIPYDRSFTTMASFDMCRECAMEYADPSSRRFHAQPNACPKCGPNVWIVPRLAVHGGYRRPPLDSRSGWERKGTLDGASVGENSSTGDGGSTGEMAIARTRHLLKQGGIIAIKGIGGVHLACDPTNSTVVEELRKRKGRIDKPFALMAHDLETIRHYCDINAIEERLLVSPHRPIVLLRKKRWGGSSGGACQLSQGVAPGQNTLGVMLPYTPLHELLLEPEEGFPRLLVMTSGNVREEPVATSNEEAISHLSSLADAFLLHNRDIHVRCDDSVVRIFEEQELPIRRSRGYSPYPVKLPYPIQSTLATGGELKNTFCVTREDYAFLSQHIGDMENFETLSSFENSVSHFENLFRIKPKRLAYDLHPNYLATRYAVQRSQKEGIIAVGVQHHHAHIAACMAENQLPGDQPVLGVAFDGTGFGTDGAIWGGEFLICTYGHFERFAHLAYVPLPGGDTAVRHPCRMALSHLHRAGVQWSSKLPCVAAVRDVERSVIAHQIRTGLNSPPTSSMGRLFDAVASLLDIRQTVNYEGQAAIELESVCDPEELSRFALPPCSETSIEVSSLFPKILNDMEKSVPVPIVSAKFHNSLATLVLTVAQRIRRERRIREVLLSGGVFQNVTLLKRTLDLLREADFVVYTHRLVPPNDGGISLGQAMVASRFGMSGGE